MEKYETVIGLEVHLQLATLTKAFCACSTKFGALPNTQVCPVCLGLPGVLPVLNRQAFRYAIKVALALGCNMQKTVKFDRKNYYYPDLPKNYQISQFDMPLAYGGKVTVPLRDGGSKDIRITRVHMEEDAGKLIHDAAYSCSYVDLNRTGTPLLEIVSEPEIRSPEEAGSYLESLKRTIKYIDVSDCNMEEGSLRCDANISIRPKGAVSLGTKVEIKNMNSFKAVRDALAYEEARQLDAAEAGEKIVQETRLWDETKGITMPMRSKEEAHDYRYFPEPDLVPFEIRREVVDAMLKEMPELPEARKARFKDSYGLDSKDIDVLIEERATADFFEEVARLTDDPRASCNWVKGEVMMHMNERNADVTRLGVKADSLAEIIGMVRDGRISGLSAKEVLRDCIDNAGSPKEIVGQKGLEQVSDTGELENLALKVISENEKSVNDFRNGKDNALSFLVGQVMKLSGGKANPKLAGEILRRNIGR